MVATLIKVTGGLSIANKVILACGFASVALLGGAFLFEYVGGLAPCKMCIWQRWAHVAVMAFAAIGLTALPRRFVLYLIAAAALGSALIAGYHAGVEWRLWDGPSGCTAALSNSVSTTDLVDQLLATPVIRCDEVAWSLFGLSMAGWNSVISAGIFGLALYGVNRNATNQQQNASTNGD